MKKFLSLVLVLVMALSLVAFAACNDANEDNGGSGNNEGGTQSGSTTTLADADIVVTTIGQSDGSTAKTLALKSGKTVYYDTTIDINTIPAGKIVVVVVGVSTKGMGSAGTDIATETARANALAARTDVEIVLLHLGNKARRGESSDGLIETVYEVAKYAFVVNAATDGGDYDGFFSTTLATSYPTTTLTIQKTAKELIDSVKAAILDLCK